MHSNMESQRYHYIYKDGMLRPSPSHGTQRLPNDDDDDDINITACINVLEGVPMGVHIDLPVLL